MATGHYYYAPAGIACKDHNPRAAFLFCVRHRTLHNLPCCGLLHILLHRSLLLRLLPLYGIVSHWCCPLYQSPIAAVTLRRRGSALGSPRVWMTGRPPTDEFPRHRHDLTPPTTRRGPNVLKSAPTVTLAADSSRAPRDAHRSTGVGYSASTHTGRLVIPYQIRHRLNRRASCDTSAIRVPTVTTSRTDD